MADQDLKWKTGESALVLFPAPNNLLWRELVVVKQFATGECVVVTPDSKLCRVSLKSPPLIDIRRLGPDRALPGDIKEVDCYMVNEATAAVHLLITWSSSVDRSARSTSSRATCGS